MYKICLWVIVKGIQSINMKLSFQQPEEIGTSKKYIARIFKKMHQNRKNYYLDKKHFGK